MNVFPIDSNDITERAKICFKNERAKKRLDGWFLAREIACGISDKTRDLPTEIRAAEELRAILNDLPLYIDDNAVFAGTQSDAFARSYALINPSFRVETFSGYCDPTAVFGDIEPDEDITQERINRVREWTKDSDYIKKLSAVYDKYSGYTDEVEFFIEQVTGHVIPDFRPLLKYGALELIDRIEKKLLDTSLDSKRRINYRAMKIALEALVSLSGRYRAMAIEKARYASDSKQKAVFGYLTEALSRVPAYGARNLYEAIQSYMLGWQVMCIEQAPNPFAFSVGNADRIFEPYRLMENTDRETSAALFKHFLAFFNVGDRSWAISQNILISGKDNDGKDLTNLSSYALLDAYYDMNLPQPILSVKLHKNTPDELYKNLGRFFFTPGCLTPSMFNDETIFPILRNAGIDENDIPDYSVAGCQEPLIMGKDNGNTTNSWLNLPKILELTLNEGISSITGKRLAGDYSGNYETVIHDLRGSFYRNAEKVIAEMTDAANGASKAIACLPVPFLSVFMGGIETGIDMRDTEEQGTAYNGSGCLIHGLSVLADSFVAVDHLIKERPEDIKKLREALNNNFEGFDELHQYLISCPKYGNNIPEVDNEAVEIAAKISDMVASRMNYLGNPFRPDWSSPSTHLTYGYLVGATPDGRKAREQLNYGVDPLYGEAGNGLGFRILSALKLPYGKFRGGYASHFGIDPKFFTAEEFEEKGIQFRDRVFKPLFFNETNNNTAPSYLYVNVTTPEMLLKVLANPKKYAPSGVYIMRIHGTFVNFLDLSPAIQEDIIKRLDPGSTEL